MNFCKSCSALCALLLFLSAGAARAQVAVSDAWVRAAPAGQMSTGAYMKLTAAADAKLVGVASPVAGFAEVHETTRDGEVMRMRAVDAVVLPAGRPVEFKPGGHHVMLFDLKRPLAGGETVPLTIEVEQGGRRLGIEVQAAVRSHLATR